METALRSAVEAALPELADVQIIAVDAIAQNSLRNGGRRRPAADTIAFLQYTSGSTSQPKGVCVSHGNLTANEKAIQAAAGGTLDDVFVSWLPLYHDMGLIGGLLNPLFTGFTAVLMSPRNFLERPRRWLEAIDRHGGTISGGPDFAYALCTDRISDETIGRLDLSRWRFAFSGSEFVRQSTLTRFGERFEPAGFDRRALTACYGLAEATLLVTAGELGAETVSYTLDTRRWPQVALQAPTKAPISWHAAKTPLVMPRASCASMDRLRHRLTKSARSGSPVRASRSDTGTIPRRRTKPSSSGMACAGCVPEISALSGTARWS